MKNTIRFVYLRRNDSSRMPVGCVAFRTGPLKDGKVSVQWSLSRHNPSDKFSRKEGRDVASSRLESSPNNLELSLEAEGKNLNTIMAEIFRLISNSSAYPYKIRKLANLASRKHTVNTNKSE